MRTPFLFALFGLTLTACAPGHTAGLVGAVLPNNTALASSYTPQNPTWVYGEFFLDSVAQTQACQDGYPSASAGATRGTAGQVTFRSTEGTATFQNNARHTAEICRALALKGQAFPDNVPPQGVDVLTTYQNSPSNPLVLLAFYGAEGRELLRVPVMNKQNSYKFNTGSSYGIHLPEGSLTVGQKSVIATANRFKISVDFGRGIESVEVTQGSRP
ncbi:hypothetical protein ACFFLM_08915 [Deinococcus oregonensis]|uniref:Lipoprotein n=1 Tax=Deinococcus oregonensis TaxID=1805970 RepID=A0ABV6AXD0_9DEIO